MTRLCRLCQDWMKEPESQRQFWYKDLRRGTESRQNIDVCRDDDFQDTSMQNDSMKRVRLV